MKTLSPFLFRLVTGILSPPGLRLYDLTTLKFFLKNLEEKNYRNDLHFDYLQTLSPGSIRQTHLSIRYDGTENKLREQTPLRSSSEWTHLKCGTEVLFNVSFIAEDFPKSMCKILKCTQKNSHLTNV